MKRTAFATAVLLGLAACGGSDSAEMETPAEDTAAPAETASTDAMTMPDWYTMDGNNVTLDITAGLTDKGNYWNYNGYQFGEVTITVPVGANVTINMTNNDPNMAHSVGISEGFETAPAMVDAVAVFDGAISENPASMTEATLPGQSTSISFVASEAGEYSMVCYIAGHAVSGMWLHFNVSAEGEAGVSGAM